MNKIIYNSEKLRMLMAKDNIKNKDIVATMNISDVGFTNIKKGRYNPTLEHAKSIAKFFNLKIDDFLV